MGRSVADLVVECRDAVSAILRKGGMRVGT